MNILEAIEEIKNNNIIKYKDEDFTYYAFQTELLPFEEKNIGFIKLEYQEMIGDSYPNKFSDLEWEELKNVCFKAIKFNHFEIISEKNMFDEIRKWIKNNI